MNNIIKDYIARENYLHKHDKGFERFEFATEGFGTYLSKVSDFFRKKINAIKEIFNITSNDKQAVNLINNNSKDINVEFGKLQLQGNNISGKGGDYFKAVSGILFPTIPGLKCDFYELSKVLKDSTGVIMTEVRPLLSEVDTYLSKIVNDEDFRLSMQPGNIAERVMKVSEKLNAPLTNIIDPKRIDDKAELKNMIPNLSSLKEVGDNLKDSLITKDLTLVSSVYDMNLIISNKIENLMKVIEKGDNLNISKVRLDELVMVLKYSSQLVGDTSAYIRLSDASYKVYEIIVSRLNQIK